MNKKGFTLIELIIVLALLSIISMGIFNFYSAELNVYSDQSYLSDVKNGERNARNYISQDIRGTDSVNFWNSNGGNGGTGAHIYNILYNNADIMQQLGATNLNGINSVNIKLFIQKQNKTAVIYALQNNKLMRMSYTVDYLYNIVGAVSGTNTIGDTNNDFTDSTIKDDAILGTKQNIQDYLPYIKDLSTLTENGVVVDDIFKDNTNRLTMVYHQGDLANTFYSNNLTVGTTTYTYSSETNIATNVSAFTTINVDAPSTGTNNPNDIINIYPTYSISIAFTEKNSINDNIDITESEINYGGDSYEIN